MFYIGTVTKEMFIRRLKRKLKSLSNATPIYYEYSTDDTLIMPVQPGSLFVIRVKTSYVDVGDTLMIELDCCEVQYIELPNKYQLMFQGQLEFHFIKVNKRKELRRYCNYIAQLLHDHYDEVNNILPLEFNHST